MKNISEWVRRWSHLVAPGATVLDLACGRGRHARWFASRGHPITAVDRSAEALESLADLAQDGRIDRVTADLEGADWPLMQAGRERQFAAVLVTNYLWRPLWPHILASLAPGGVLIYETFASGNETVGKPSRPDFLLQPGELLQRCAGLHIVAYEDGFEPEPARYVQRIAAVRPLGRMQDYRFYLRL